MIKAEGFSKSYSNVSSKNTGVYEVENVSFCMEDGSVSALLGANGSGKSTLIKALYAIHYPTAGKVFVSDRSGLLIDCSENPELVKQCTGYVPEVSVLPKNMTVKEILLYAGNLHGVGKLCGESGRLEELKDLCALDEVWNKKAGHLSKGYCQRVSFAQAIIHNPVNLILDEPITGLDPNQIVHMRKLIMDYAKKNTVLMSTHILGEVTNLCKNIFIMNHGRLAAGGTEGQILTETGCKNLEEAFLKVSS